MSDSIPPYLFPALTYGLVGGTLSLLALFCARLRRERGFHVAVLLVFLIATQVVLAVTMEEPTAQPSYHLGVKFFLLLLAGIAYVPAVVVVVLQYWELLVERVLSASRLGEERKDDKERDTMEQVREYQQRLATDPSDAGAREQLADLYVRLGFWDSAVYEYRRTSDWLERGYAHAYVLYKAAYVIAEKRKDLSAAAPLLRRVVRLYPRSYFAAYARRVLNHFEAHAQADGHDERERNV